MIQVESVKRPSPSPSRSSLRSERGVRQPRVIHVNRDASTMVDAAGAGAATDWEPCAAAAAAGPGGHFRSRTFSDGFIRNTSLELLLGVDCDACLALATQHHCADKHISDQDLDLVCNCNVQQNNYLNCHRDPIEQRGHTLSIYDLERIKRDTGRNHLTIGSHRSLDRKHTKSKTIGVSNYISKQLISYDPTNTLVQKIKRKLSNLKKISGETISKKHQNAVQLAEITSGSSSSLKKLSMLSLVDRSNRRVNSQSCVFSSSSQFQMKDECKGNAPSYANFSGNVDQPCLDRLRDCNIDTSRRTPRKMVKMRSFDNNEDILARNMPIGKSKFTTLDNRSRCRSIRRQLSYNDFPSERFRESSGESWGRDNASGSMDAADLMDDNSQAFLDPELMMMGAPRSAHAQCTCEGHDKRIPSIFYDTQVINSTFQIHRFKYVF